MEKRRKKTVKLTSDGKVVPDEDIFLKTQNFVSHQHSLEMRETANYLKEQSDRLSQPKLKILIPGSGSHSLSRNTLTTAATPNQQSYYSNPLLSPAGSYHQ